MSEMVERVARAVCKAFAMDYHSLCEIDANFEADKEWENWIPEAKAAIAAMQADAAPVATYRHKKRGTLYTVIGEGTLQCSANELLDNQPIVVYRGEDGKLWARGVAEFHDGRFEAVDDRVSTSSPVVAHETPETSDKLRDAVEVCQSCGGDGWDGTAYVGQFKCGQCNGTGVVKQSLTTEPLSNSKELRPAIAVFFDAADAGSFGVEPCDAPTCTDCAKAAAVIEADRAALVAEIVADLYKETRTYKGSEYSGFAAMIAEDIAAKWGGK